MLINHCFAERHLHPESWVGNLSNNASNEEFLVIIRQSCLQVLANRSHVYWAVIQKAPFANDTGSQGQELPPPSNSDRDRLNLRLEGQLHHLVAACPQFKQVGSAELISGGS